MNSALVGQYYTSAPLAAYIVEVGTSTYIAEAAPGTELTAARWRCKRVVEISPTITRVTWADGDADFNNTANNVATLNYS